jgi:hypothetical protein
MMTRFSKKKVEKDSIFEYKDEKLKWKLGNDSSSMGYAIYMKKEFNGGLDISYM